jgi:hypothetical protein
VRFYDAPPHFFLLRQDHRLLFHHYLYGSDANNELVIVSDIAWEVGRHYAGVFESLWMDADICLEGVERESVLALRRWVEEHFAEEASALGRVEALCHELSMTLHRRPASGSLRLAALGHDIERSLAGATPRPTIAAGDPQYHEAYLEYKRRHQAASAERFEEIARRELGLPVAMITRARELIANHDVPLKAGADSELDILRAADGLQFLMNECDRYEEVHGKVARDAKVRFMSRVTPTIAGKYPSYALYGK